ncbi:MAG: exosortase/archaeosortase family protein [Candidatus Diapherotrites archaeon]|nr:exosortase/archaeosortase family protein [Candidatus Diapherotrites archaeon]
MPSKKKYAFKKKTAKRKAALPEKIKSHWAKQEEKIRKSQLRQFEFFILGFVLFYLIVSAIVSIVPQSFFEALTGMTLKSLLALQGLEVSGAIKAVEGFGEVFVLQIGSGTAAKEIIISWLCSGTFEIIILACAILASFGVEWRKKFHGIAVAIIAGYFFNLIRVWLTVNIVLTQNIQIVEFAHDLLFRAVLFLYITGFYILWFFWAVGATEKTIGKKRI